MSKETVNKILTKEFVFDGKYYMYDTYTNTLLQITKEHYLAINEYKKNGFPHESELNTLSDPQKEIMMLKHRGMFSTQIVKEINNPHIPYVESLLLGSVNDMTLQITRMCNFDCRYCLYAGEEGIERTHENDNMSLEVAYKSIDFLFAHSCDSNKINIAFYGGEPLLNFELIQKVVEYVKTKFYSKAIQYSMTSNGSILNEEIVHFLIENNFFLSISLDGPEHVQNKHRTFRNTGKGTFNTVMRNVQYIKKNFPDFFYKNLSFTPVVIDDENYEIVSSFFSQHDILKTNVTPLKANLNGIDYYLSSASDIDNSSIRNIDKDSAGINDDALHSLRNMYNRKTPIPSVWHHNGQCVPGIQRVFVDCHGILFPCEKVVENKAFVIGNIEEGFNINKIIEMLSIGKLSEERCKNCWAMRFCEICVSLCLDVDTNKFSASMKEHACKAQEDNAMWILKKIIRGK